VIHYETIPMCCLLWTSPQIDQIILSQYVAIFCPNLSLVSCQIPSHECASTFGLEVTCFSTLKSPCSNLGTRFFLRGEGCDTPGVSFVLRRESYPNLGCSVKNSIFSLAYVSDYPNFSFTSHRIRSDSVSQKAEFEAC
jgi:hypothetical protein